MINPFSPTSPGIQTPRTVLRRSVPQAQPSNPPQKTNSARKLPATASSEHLTPLIADHLTFRIVLTRGEVNVGWADIQPALRTDGPFLYIAEGFVKNWYSIKI